MNLKSLTDHVEQLVPVYVQPAYDKNAAESFAFEPLPRFLRKLCTLVPNKPDVFLIGALPVIAAHLTNVTTPRIDGNYSLDLYTMVVAPFASGKGVLRYARMLGAEADAEIIGETVRAREQWLLSLKSGDQGCENESASKRMPIERGFFVAGNSSGASFMQRLFANPRSLIFETEIDTLANSLKKEWGQFDDNLRKAYHHEPIMQSRLQTKETESGILTLDRPQVSMCLSGTEAQCWRLFGAAGIENGLFSRL